MKPRFQYTIVIAFLLIGNYCSAAFYQDSTTIDANSSRIQLQSTAKIEEWNFLDDFQSTKTTYPFLKETYLNIQLNNELLLKSKRAVSDYTSVSLSISYIKPLIANRKGFSRINLACKKFKSLNEKATNILAIRLGLDYYFPSVKLNDDGLWWEKPRPNQHIRGPHIVEIQFQSVLYMNVDLRHQLGQLNLPIFKNVQLGLLEYFDSCLLGSQIQYSIGIGAFAQFENQRTISISLIKKSNQRTVIAFQTGFFF